MASPQPRIGVVMYPGSNDDHDALWALAALDADAIPVWHEERELPALDAVLLPGGFSYGDYLRCGAIARFSPATAAVCEFARDGRARARHLQRLPDPLRGGAAAGRAAPERVAAVHLPRRAADRRARRSPVHDALRAGQELVIPVKHGDGRWFAPPQLLAELEANRQVVLRYAEPCNGSVDDIAGVCNERGNVMGLMPHPEHAVDPLLGSADGALILASLVEAARDHAVALA